MVGLKDAMVSLRHELAKDKTEGSYYYSWQANIVMAFKDEFNNRTNGNAHTNISNETLHDIANNAAKNFLDILIMDENKK